MRTCATGLFASSPTTPRRTSRRAERCTCVATTSRGLSCRRRRVSAAILRSCHCESSLRRVVLSCRECSTSRLESCKVAQRRIESCGVIVAGRTESSYVESRRESEQVGASHRASGRQSSSLVDSKLSRLTILPVSVVTDFTNYTYFTV